MIKAFFKKLFSSDGKEICTLLFFCLVTILIWFKDKKLLATGEEGLFLIDPAKSLELYKNSWSEIGSGLSIPGTNTTVPFFYLEQIILKLNIPIWFFQAALFYLLMAIGTVATYFLTKNLFKVQIKNNQLKLVGLISALFYILNPISLLGVWSRFLLPFIFFYALVPLFLLLYIWGLQNRRKIFILIAPLTTLLFSFVFAAPSLTLLLWVIPFIYSLVSVFSFSTKGKLKLDLYPFIYFCLAFTFWVLISLWWIIPFVELSKLAFAAETSLEHAVGTLKANSQDFKLENVIRLIHAGILYRGEFYGEIYKRPFFVLLSFLIPLLVFSGLYHLKKSQIKKFLGASLFFLIFFVKGVSAPFGGIFLWLFTHLAFLQVYRNPMEKIGLLLPVIYAPLFGFGVYLLLKKIKNLRVREVFVVIVIGLLLVNSWPFFTGAIISFNNRDIRVVVPDSFQNLADSIPTGDHIIFSLPQMGGLTGIYKWEHKYLGAEGSEFLFKYPTIAKFSDATSFYGQLLIAVSHGDITNLISIAQLFSADLIAFRKDTDINAFGDNPKALVRSEKMIKDAHLTNIFDSKEVSIWSLPMNKIVNVIYAPSKIRFGDSAEELISLLKKENIDFKDEVYICTNSQKCKPTILPKDLSQIRIEKPPEKIEFIKHSPVSYQVKVTGSIGKFLIVFNNSYHPGWRVFINGNLNSEKNHFVANGYANGFIVEEKGNFDIFLKFTPEEKIVKYYKISFFVITFGIVLILFYSLRIFLKSKK